MKLKKKKTKLPVKKAIASECFNCGHPFFGNEKFCPECGQKNKNPKITFGSFVHEVFNGFISWDSKFWTTFIPLLTKPGKVSRDYIDGKRQRYANPFRFYLTISVLFFLMLGALKSYEEIGYLNSSKQQSSNIINFNVNPLDSIKARDSLKTNNTRVNQELNMALENIVLQGIDSLEGEKILKEIPAIKNNSLFGFIKGNKISKFKVFYEKYPKTSIDNALDSLNYEKTFFNRFLYDRVKTFKNFNEEKDFQEVANKSLSYISISLFILLPIFAFALKLFYIRRKFTYIEHLIFIFHTQTVFFLLLLIFFPISYYQESENLVPVFLILFLIYLFLAMKNFYKQGRFKTFIKFVIINNVYLFLSSIGMLIILLISFALY